MTYQKNTGRSYTQSWLSKGFTLIELLVVVLIIGILAAVAVPQYQKAVLKSRLAQWDVMFDAGRKAVELYLLENGWPESGTVYLTGKDRVGTIEMPGNCDIDGYGCYTSAGMLDAECSIVQCDLRISGRYNADGTTGNKALGDERSEVRLYRRPNGDWFTARIIGKVGCLWTSTHPDIPVFSDFITECKDRNGVTLPNPEYTE